MCYLIFQNVIKKSLRRQEWAKNECYWEFHQIKLKMFLFGWLFLLHFINYELTSFFNLVFPIKMKEESRKMYSFSFFRKNKNWSNDLKQLENAQLFSRKYDTTTKIKNRLNNNDEKKKQIQIHLSYLRAQ